MSGTQHTELFQYISDAHLENCRDYPRLTQTARYLFLVGDIGHISSSVWQEFIRYLHEQTQQQQGSSDSQNVMGWNRIFYVLGNHEYYSNSKTMSVLKKAYQDFLSEFPGLLYLTEMA